MILWLYEWQSLLAIKLVQGAEGLQQPRIFHTQPRNLSIPPLWAEKPHQKLLWATSWPKPPQRRINHACFASTTPHISPRVTSPRSADSGAEAKCCFRQRQREAWTLSHPEEQQWLAQDIPEEQRSVSSYSGIKHCHPAKAASSAAIQTQGKIQEYLYFIYEDIYSSRSDSWGKASLGAQAILTSPKSSLPKCTAASPSRSSADKHCVALLGITPTLAARDKEHTLKHLVLG